MPQTPRMGWVFPGRGQQPYYTSLVSFYEAVDGSANAAREDRNVLVSGNATFTSASSGTLTWDAEIQIHTPTAGVVATVPAGSIDLLVGQFMYVDLPRRLLQPAELTPKKSSTPPESDSTFVIGLRIVNEVVFRNGLVLFDGESGPVFGVSAVVAGALPSITDSQIYVGSAGGNPVAQDVSGDVTIDAAGVVTIEDDAVTNAKIADDAVNADKILDTSVLETKLNDEAISPRTVQLYETFDFESEGGTVRVPAPATDTDAANRQYVDDVYLNRPEQLRMSGGMTVEGTSSPSASGDLVPLDMSARVNRLDAALFAVVLWSSDGAETATAKLIDRGDPSNPVLATITTTNTTPTFLFSVLTVGTSLGDLQTGERTYEVEVETTGGGGVFAYLGSSHLRLQYL